MRFEEFLIEIVPQQYNGKLKTEVTENLIVGKTTFNSLYK
jgi:hypothetical protein